MAVVLARLIVLFCLLMLESWHRLWIDPAAGEKLELSPPGIASGSGMKTAGAA